MAEPIRTPEGAVHGAAFGGLLEGRLGDRVALERAVRRLRETGPVDVTLEVEGDRFSIYLADAPLDAERATPERMQALLDGLQSVVRTARVDAPLDSTLRCTEIYEHEVVETHFALEGEEAGDGPALREVTPVSRVRARSESDHVPTPVQQPEGPLLDERPRRVLLTVVGVLLVGLLLWQARIVDRFFGPGVDTLESSGGIFGALVEVELEGALGGYRALLSRGADYPRTGADVDRLEAAAATPLERAAVSSLADGEPLEVRLLNDAGEVLVRARASSDALLRDPEGAVPVVLPARLGAARIELGLPVSGTPRGGLR